MTNSNALTASNIRYLLTMKELDGDGRGVRCIALATALGLSKPSVHNMMGTFSQMGLISRDSYGAAFLPMRATSLPAATAAITPVLQGCSGAASPAWRM